MYIYICIISPLKNISQLGLFAIYGEIEMFQTTNQHIYIIYIPYRYPSDLHQLSQHFFQIPPAPT